MAVVAEDLNRGVAAELGCVVEVFRWETDAAPDLHTEGPQGVIDPLLAIENADVFIGILWKRFGTPTCGARSGTEHEILDAYESWTKNRRPRIMLYFNQEPATPKTKEEAEQWALVLELREKFSGRGVICEYTGEVEFERQVRRHLTQFLRSPEPPAKAEGGRPLGELMRAYGADLAQQVDTVRLFNDAEPRPLERVFVDLDIMEELERPRIETMLRSVLDSHFGRERGLFEPAARRDEDEGDKVRRVSPDALLRQSTRAVITGAPGCGKTTLIKYLALKTLRAGARLPVLLELKTIPEALFGEVKEDLAELLFEKAVAGLLQLRDGGERRLVREHFFELLQKGEVVIFLDGLDEVRGEDFFPGLCRAVNAFMRSAYRYNDLIITTRPYALTRFEGLKEMEIAPLGRGQINAFLNHYYPDPALVRKLLLHINRHRELYELTRVPFLLGVIAELYRSEDDVAGDRLRLYRRIVRLLVIKLDNEKAVERFYVEDPTGSAKLELLERLAYERLFVDAVAKDIERLVFTDDDILHKARACCPAGVNPDHLTADVIATPLLREVGDGTYAFAHLTLQEYLAARRLAEQEGSERIFCQKVFSPAVVATEVLPMALGFVRNPDDFYCALERLPESLTFTVLRLRARGLAYARKIAPEHLTALIERVLKYQKKRAVLEHPHINTILRSFAAATGQPLELILARLVSALRERDAELRRAAAKVLGEIGDARGVGALRHALWDEDRTVRVAAAAALGKIGDPAALEDLRAAFDTVSQDFEKRRRQGALLLREQENERLRATLRWHAARPEDADATEPEAEEELGRLEVLEADEGEEPPAGWAARAARMLPTAQRRAESDWLFASREADDPSQDELYMGLRRAISAITRTSAGGESGLPPIPGQTPIDFTEYYRRARKAERRQKSGAEPPSGESAQGDPDARPPELSEHPEPPEKEKPKENVNQLLARLKDQSMHGRRLDAIERLGKLNDSRVVEGLVEALRDVSFDIRERAARALGEIGDRRAVEGLLEAFRGGRGGTLRMAAEALRKVGDWSAVEGLLEILRDADFERRWLAAETLGIIGDVRALDGLLAALSDGKAIVRANAAAALGKLRDRRAVGGLLRVLSDASEEVQVSAAASLGELRDPRAVELLMTAARVGPTKTRCAAAAALGAIGDPRALDALLAALADKHTEVRFAAMKALGSVASPGAVGTLLTSLKDPHPSIRQRAAEALGRFEDASAPGGLLSVLKDGSSDVRRAAALALRRFDNEVLRKGLEYALSHENDFVRKIAAQGVGYYADTAGVLEKLTRLGQSDPSEGVRAAASRAHDRYEIKLKYFNRVGAP